MFGNQPGSIHNLKNMGKCPKLAEIIKCALIWAKIGDILDISPVLAVISSPGTLQWWKTILESPDIVQEGPTKGFVTKKTQDCGRK